MSTLHIALQEGFSHDEVHIDVAGAQVYSKPNVSTRLQLGLADSFATDVKDEEVVVRIDLPARRIAEQFVVNVAQNTYLGICIGRHGGIEHRVSATAFGYA